MNISKPAFISPSTLSSFISYRHSWYASKILGMPFASTHYFERGKAIEHGVRCALEGKSIDEAVEEANKMMSDSFATLNLSDSDQEQCAEYAIMMREYIQCGAKHLSSYGKLNDRKHPGWTQIPDKNKPGEYVELGVKVEYKHPEVEVPFYGYLDFLFDGWVVDLKVLARKPSSLTQGYKIQGRIYEWATRKPVAFEVLSHTKSRGVECTTLPLAKEQHLDRLDKYIIAASKTLLGVYDCVANGDTSTLLRLMSFPDIDAVFNVQEREALFTEFVTNAKFLSNPEPKPCKEEDDGCPV